MHLEPTACHLLGLAAPTPQVLYKLVQQHRPCQTQHMVGYVSAQTGRDDGRPGVVNDDLHAPPSASYSSVILSGLEYACENSRKLFHCTQEPQEDTPVARSAHEPTSHGQKRQNVAAPGRQ